MEILYWNIMGIVLLISFVIFILKFYKNHNVIDENRFEEVKMNVKVVKEPQTNFGYNSNYQETQKTTLKPDTKKSSGSTSNELLFIKIPTPNILNDARLKYLGDSRDAGTIYAILPEDLKYLTKGRYSILENINSEIGDGRDYTSQSKIRTFKDIIQNQKYKASM